MGMGGGIKIQTAPARHLPTCCIDFISPTDDHEVAQPTDIAKYRDREDTGLEAGVGRACGGQGGDVQLGWISAAFTVVHHRAAAAGSAVVLRERGAQRGGMALDGRETARRPGRRKASQPSTRKPRILSFRGESKSAMKEHPREHATRPSGCRVSEVRGAGGGEEEVGEAFGRSGGRLLRPGWPRDGANVTGPGRDLAEQRRRCMQIDAAGVAGAILPARPGSATGESSGKGDRAWVAPTGDLPETPTSQWN
ncbi:hypothetical protein B0H17DRAFT_1263209 [Mycena rosella]|uniref:Uncharacterized protein n=1 Tax=Mycena rosella TaxID=1033263 RepID=A0AAD7GJB7_MYCRO|nr:hypothetical protein B0H17DRAFT_1263209 [Mycena rosella]